MNGWNVGFSEEGFLEIVVYTGGYRQVSLIQWYYLLVNTLDLFSNTCFAKVAKISVLFVTMF